MFSKEDRLFMLQALTLAWAVKGSTAPNPAVGAVVVKNGAIISSGYTLPPGGFHAERMALNPLSLEAAEGSTLYVTLEPCCFQGRTPPCTDVILEKKVRRVVFSVLDPYPEVAGRGAQILKQAGVQVEQGLLEKEAFDLNRDFFIYASQNRPMVTLKYAMTLDGKMAAFSGDSKWITHDRSRRLTHLLRYRCDAILVGSGTVKADNPVLNARIRGREKALLRVILDPQGETSESSFVFSDSLPTLFVVKKRVSKEFLTRVQKRKKHYWVDESEEDEIHLRSLMAFLAREYQITSVFVEGGSRTLGSFLKQKLGDQVFVFLGNQILGEGISPFAGKSSELMSDSVKLKGLHMKALKENWLIRGVPDW